MPTRRTFLKTGAAAIAAAVGADTAVFEPDHVVLVQEEITLTRLPVAWDGLRILQMSDFHYDPYFSVFPIRKAVALAQNLKPDLIVLTGDFITDTSPSRKIFNRKQQTADLDSCAQLLGSLRCPMGSFAVLGNHDVSFGAKTVIAAIQSNGIHVLRNSSQVFERNDARLWLAGTDDILEGRPDLVSSLSGKPKDDAVILLAHEPDFILESSQHGVDLQLSGHSHGGQIRIPLLGAPCLPDLARKFPKGHYHVRSSQLYTNAGIGTITLPIRFDCPPEVTLFTLRSGSLAKA